MKFPKFSEDYFLYDIKKWIENGGSVTIIKPDSGESLLHIAAEFQDISAIKYLIVKGVDPNLQDKYGQTPLHIVVDSEIDRAIQKGHYLIDFKATKVLLELGANLKIKDKQGNTVIDWVNSYGEKVAAIFKNLLDEVNIQDY